MSTLLATLLVILPVFFLPVAVNFYDTPKWVLFCATSLLVLIFWVWRMIMNRRADVSMGPAVYGIGALVFSALVSLIFSSVNKIEAVIDPWGLATFAAFVILAVFALPLISQREKQIMTNGLIVVSSLCGLLTLYQRLGVGLLLLPSLPWLNDPAWTPLGTPISLLSFLILILPLAFWQLLKAIHERLDTKIVLYGGALVSILVGLGLTIWFLLFTPTGVSGPTIPNLLLSFKYGVIVLLQTWKTPLQFLFGSGAEQFVSVFALGKPASINQTALWNVVPATNASLLLHIGTIYGLTGLTALLVFGISIFINFERPPLLKLIFGIIALIVLFFPPSLPVFITILLVILIFNTSDTVSYSVNTGGAIITAIPIVIMVLMGLLGLYQVFTAEQLFFQSMLAAQKNDGNKTYNLQISAISHNPTQTRYHLALSRTNLALIQSIVKENNVSPDASVGVDMNQEDKETIGKLAEQALREAKLAASLAPRLVSAWVNLANVYQVFITTSVNSTNDAPLLATAAYQKAIQLDPNNPVLRLDLGRLYLDLKKTEDAHAQFLAAITLKPDFVNAYYNLGHLLIAKGDTVHGKQALEKARDLLPHASADYQQIEEELLKLQ